MPPQPTVVISWYRCEKAKCICPTGVGVSVSLVPRERNSLMSLALPGERENRVDQINTVKTERRDETTWMQIKYWYSKNNFPSLTVIPCQPHYYLRLQQQRPYILDIFLHIPFALRLFCRVNYFFFFLLRSCAVFPLMVAVLRHDC